ncbi:hypothetical protein RHSIM_Rhsim06G0198600 [Rhododendron simsii]|uniref:Metallothionein-like protein n=1 Tax=Rhododendron simsii TaxID=118357 RepID=A0A834GRY3_RHOSS|nr:hypothetical protein RHSIM_Rhsim06G0198600 [Rhododendron simsii]
MPLGQSLLATVNKLDYEDYRESCIKEGLMLLRKKGNTIVIETEKSYNETFVVDAPAAENDGKCKCGAGCSCVSCTCGH